MTGSSTKQASAEPQIKGLPLSRLAGVHAGLAERQPIDSVLATEPIPGAPAVGAALDASAKAATRAAGMDSTAR